MRVLVTGAAGRLGRALLPGLVAAGHDVRAMSRRERPAGGDAAWVRANLATGEGVARALDGVDAVVHLAAAPYRGRYTDRVEVAGTSRLLGAAAPAGVGHLVYVSIAGCDRIPWGYFRTKVRTEALLAGGGLPWSVVRSTQFHSFVDQALTLAARTGVLLADPGITARPVDVTDVADRLVRQVGDGPSGGVEDFVGPEVLGLADAVHRWRAARGLRRPVVRLRVPGRLGREFRAGHLAGGTGEAGRITWDAYLATRYG
ncbi:SDR family oxidoreductase [Streptomyces hainanensis]|uniref:NAD-dependent epimerase/dehydratase family protein n=1 Tax=Streptomyces hainanensis TaxID=402648 RepID=A0A4R4TLT8_9ACTN|nr:NAD(P)H-binding protein [Streptomyces hainanensis]TDC77556.1 NAD-dependent epimerase/dehydratase family protein [Streptomyces hainanensis]